MDVRMGIEIGPLRVGRLWSGAEGDRAVLALQRFYTANGLGPEDISDEEKLEAVLQWFIDAVKTYAVEEEASQQLAAQMDAIRNAAREAVSFGGGKKDNRVTTGR